MFNFYLFNKIKILLKVTNDNLKNDMKNFLLKYALIIDGLRLVDVKNNRISSSQFSTKSFYYKYNKKNLINKRTLFRYILIIVFFSLIFSINSVEGCLNENNKGEFVSFKSNNYKIRIVLIDDFLDETEQVITKDFALKLKYNKSLESELTKNLRNFIAKFPEYAKHLDKGYILKIIVISTVVEYD